MVWGTKQDRCGGQAIAKAQVRRVLGEGHLLRMHTHPCIPLLLQPQIQTGCGKAMKATLIRQTKNFKLQIS